jgi:hypothetical protein
VSGLEGPRPNPGPASPTLITTVVFSRVRLKQVITSGQLEGLEGRRSEAVSRQASPTCPRCRGN